MTALVLLPAAVQVLSGTRDRDLLAGGQVVAATVTGNALAIPVVVLALTAIRRILK